MNRNMLASAMMAALPVLGVSLPAGAQTHQHLHMQMEAAAQTKDTRQPVKFPRQLRQHELANMRGFKARSLRASCCWNCVSKNAMLWFAHIAGSEVLVP